MSEPLTAAQRVAIARHPQRPNITDYIQALFTDFFEQKGDRLCGEDAAILGGVALYHGRPVTVIGTRKGKTLEENLRCNFGMPGPEGYRKALRLMKQAEKFDRPIITFIDTPGAYPGKEAEERGQGDEADAFTGEAQVLGEGACQNCVGVHGQQARHFHAVEGQKTVRFVDYEIERAAIAFGGLGEDGGQAFELFAGIDGPGGVVGRVDDHGAGLGRDGRLNGGQIKPEGTRQGRDLLERTAVVANIGAVFHEIGGHGEHFVAGFQNGPEDHVERARGPAGQDDVVGRELCSLFLGKVGGELFAGPAEPVVRHVAEAERFVHVLDEFGQRLANGGRGSEIRVPEAEIAYGARRRTSA